MEGVPLLQTNFRVAGSTKSAGAFNSTVQSGAIRVMPLEEFIKQSSSVNTNIHSKDAIPIPSTVVVVIMLEYIQKATKTYVCMKITDLRGSDAILVYDQSTAVKKAVKIEMHSVIYILKANIMHLKDALYLKSQENQILVLGRAINVGICKYVSFTDGSCSNAIDTSVSIYCPTHTAGVATTPNSAGIRLYENISLVDSTILRAHLTSKQIHFSSNFTFNEIVDHITDYKVQLESIKTNQFITKKRSLVHAAENEKKLIGTSTNRLYAKLKTCLQEEGKGGITRAMLCKECEVVAIVPQESCIKGGHSLEIIHVKMHQYQCNTCFKIYKTIRKHGPSFPCSVCFANMWISTIPS